MVAPAYAPNPLPADPGTLATLPGPNGLAGSPEGALGTGTSAYTPDFSDISVAFNYARGERFGADRMTGMQMYYKKGPECRDAGYVIIASATPVEMVRMMDKGFQPLRHLGQFQLWNAAENWRVSHEPYRRIFQRPGAINLFPLAQIIEHLYHLAPPYAGVVFPQLAALDAAAYAFRCLECQRFFVSERLLQGHRSVAHRGTAQNNALGEAIAASISKMNRPVADALTPMLQALQEQMAAFQVVVQGLNLSQQEQQRVNRLLFDRVGYGGHLGVPPEPTAPDPGGGPPPEPVAASRIDLDAVVRRAVPRAVNRPDAEEERRRRTASARPKGRQERG